MISVYERTLVEEINQPFTTPLFFIVNDTFVKKNGKHFSPAVPIIQSFSVISFFILNYFKEKLNFEFILLTRRQSISSKI